MTFWTFLGLVALGIAILAMFPRVGMVVGLLIIAAAGFVMALPLLLVVWGLFFAH